MQIQLFHPRYLWFSTLFILFCNLNFAGAQKGITFIVTAPATGDLLQAGSSFEIKWVSFVDAQVITLSLANLVAGPSNLAFVVLDIATSIENTESYLWKIPQDIESSASYAIKLVYAGNPNNVIYSEKFTLVGSVPANNPSSAAAVSNIIVNCKQRPVRVSNPCTTFYEFKLELQFFGHELYYSGVFCSQFFIIWSELILTSL
ncbi:hypothetical protein ABW20_dc0101391 [Dactylellina cionopaga]|nr:hypothetical protein ABW20_dc0101391 [Dactylellina cionopaga]